MRHKCDACGTVFQTAEPDPDPPEACPRCGGHIREHLSPRERIRRGLKLLGRIADGVIWVLLVPRSTLQFEFRKENTKLFFAIPVTVLALIALRIGYYVVDTRTGTSGQFGISKILFTLVVVGIWAWIMKRIWRWEL